MEANKRRYQSVNTRTSYIEGNTVRKLNAIPDTHREERRRVAPQPRRQTQVQPRVFSGINFASLLVLTIAIIATVYVCVEYLQLQTGVSRMEKSIVSMEKELTTLTNENNAAYASIDTATDLDYIYEVAVQKLGMVYPNNNKVITYESTENDYVRQYEDIPD